MSEKVTDTGWADPWIFEKPRWREYMPTRPTIFHRGGKFYVVLTYPDEGFSELGEYAVLNTGITAIEDMHGNVLWRPQ